MIIKREYADWNHADCTPEHCYWMMPTSICQGPQHTEEVKEKLYKDTIIIPSDIEWKEAYDPQA